MCKFCVVLPKQTCLIAAGFSAKKTRVGLDWGQREGNREKKNYSLAPKLRRDQVSPGQDSSNQWSLQEDLSPKLNQEAPWHLKERHPQGWRRRGFVALAASSGSSECLGKTFIHP